MQFIVFTLQAVLCSSLALLVILWGWIHWKNRSQISFASTLPHIYKRAYPILGHLYLAKFTWEDTTKVLLNALSESTGPTSGLWLGPFPLILVSRPEDIKTVLNSSSALNKAPEYNLFHFLIGNGLLTAPDYIWVKSRKLMNFVFHPRNVKHVEDAVSERARQFVEDMSQFVDQGQVDLTDQLFGIVTKNIVSLLFGADAEVDPSSEGFKSWPLVLEDATNIVFKKLTMLWLRWDYFSTTLTTNLLKKTDISFEDIAGKHLRKRLVEIENLQNSETTTRTTTSFIKDNPDHLDYADVLHRLRKKNPEVFGGKYFQHETLTILFAGTDTVLATLVMSLVSLACHPDIQDKLYEEIERVVGSRSQGVSVEDVTKMTYLDQVVKETMRRFTAVPVVGRQTSKDIVISDCTVPVKSAIIINIYGLHMNPEIYPEPHVFDPDRFSAENVARRGKYTYLPFSGGGRDCIGRYYALLMMKIILAHLVREFTFSTKLDFNNLRFRYALSLVCADGCKVSLTKRN